MQAQIKRADIIQLEYADITERWIERHIMAETGLTVVVAVMEFVFAFLVHGDWYYNASLWETALRYFVVPTGFNVVFLGAALLVWQWDRAVPRTKATVATISHVLIAFVTYAAHTRFEGLYLIFAIPVIFSVVYGDTLLTLIGSVGGMAAMTVSDLFIRWDPYSTPKFTSMETILDYVIAVTTLAAVDVICLLIIRTEQEKHAASILQEEEKQELFQQINTDPLTGIQNRNGLRRALERMEADKSGKDYWFVMMDLDHFKSINDTYGHIVGDQYLQQLSAILGEVSTASAFRFGGDEFCLLFCGCSRSWVQQICTMIKDRFLETPLCQEVTQATLSFGAAVYQRDFSTAKLVRQADSALYRAKQNRGSLCFYDELQK